MHSLVEVVQLNKKDEERWNNLLSKASNASYRQNMSFEYIKASRSRIFNTFIFRLNDEDIAGAHYSIKKSYNGIIKVADILSGFIFKNEPTSTLLVFLTEHFTNWAKVQNASYARINSWYPKKIGDDETEYNRMFESVFFQFNYRKTAPGRNSYWIDISQDENAILANMKRQTRYDIRKGLKSDLSINILEKVDSSIIDKFWDFYKALASKKGFSMYTERRFKDELFCLLEAKLAKLFVIKCENRIINISIASTIGIGEYLHGAKSTSSDDLNNCPSPGHLAQWTMLSSLKNSGLKIYDLGFCPGPIPIKTHPAYQIWRFKYGFGGQSVEYMPTYGKIIRPLQGGIFKIIRYFGK